MIQDKFLNTCEILSILRLILAIDCSLHERTFATHDSPEKLIIEIVRIGDGPLGTRLGTQYVVEAVCVPRCALLEDDCACEQIDVCCTKSQFCCTRIEVMKVDSANKKTSKRASRKLPVAKPVTAAKLSHRHHVVMVTVKESGLLAEKDGRISGRISQKLVDSARSVSGAMSDTELIELALACLALEDNSGRVLASNWGSVDPDADFGI